MDPETPRATRPVVGDRAPPIGQLRSTHQRARKRSFPRLEMSDSTDADFDAALAPLRARLAVHPLYDQLRDERTLRLFMETHVFAVWDFQSLLKALQRLVTCVEVPWLPTSDPEARRLVNEIILDEESDHSPGGGHLSHFELYLRAMKECGAQVAPIHAFMGHLRAGRSVDEALDECGCSRAAGRFVRSTMAVAQSGRVHRVAAAFAYGREEVIPGMFRRLVDRLAGHSLQRWGTLRFYLDRHIGTDADRHGPQSRDLVRRLCGNNANLWSEAVETARASLEARVRLWVDVARSVADVAESKGF